MNLRPYQSRLADARLSALLHAFPAVLINGPRATGKTTTAMQHAKDVVQLDRPADAVAFAADPDAALKLRQEPLLLDEWQEVPGVLGAVRRAVDLDPRPGRFVLTGSVRAELGTTLWPGTGRLITMQMYGLTEAEILGHVGSERRLFLDRVQEGDATLFPFLADRPTLPKYIGMAVRGGFPEVAITGLEVDSAHAWLESYLHGLITKDLRLDVRRNTGRMRAYFEALALNTAGIPQATTLAKAVGINIRTVESYDDLFESVFVTEKVRAWSNNRLTRLTRTPKRYVVDSGLAAAAAGLTAATILSDGDLLGRMLDTFVAAQLRPEVALNSRFRAHHLRTKEGREEVDLIVEVGGGRLIAIETKATAAPSASDVRHLSWLRDIVGDRFVVGVVLHTGPAAFRLGDRLLALPISTIWD